MRGYEYREFLGHKGFYANAELRFPLIHAMATPIGILGGIRGVFFFNVGGAGVEGQPFKIWDNNAISSRRPSQTRTASSRARASASTGFRLADARASYGIGLETFALGFPVHFDWSYRTLFNKEWEDYNYGSSEDVPQGALHGVDWVRLLEDARNWNLESIIWNLNTFRF